MGHVGSKNRSLGQVLEKPCVRSRGHGFSPIILKLRVFILMESWTSLKMVRLRSVTRSKGQILKKPCIHSRGHIFSLIMMKLGQNVCLDEIVDEVEYGSC